MNVDHSLIMLLRDFLVGRRRCVAHDGELSSWRTVNLGVGQGTVQGPIMFIIATLFINCVVPNMRYADDINVVFDGDCNHNIMDETLLSLKSNFNDAGLSL